MLTCPQVEGSCTLVMRWKDREREKKEMGRGKGVGAANGDKLTFLTGVWVCSAPRN